MGRVIAISNQKGGVGKTTTAINLSACLAEKGKKVLVVDIDPQGNATSGLGVEKEDIENTVYDILVNYTPIWETITPSVVENLSVIPSERGLAGAEIIIDCPPSLSTLTVNAMTTADSVLVPIQCEYYALEGLSELTYTIELVRNRLNEKLEIEGIVFTMYDGRTCLSSQVVENVKDNMRENIYETIIPRNIRLAEAPSHGLPINLYEPKSAGADAYRSLAEEVIERGKK